MKRNIDINQISDGNLYELNDMVKVDCNDCVGCSACCKGMGESIVLDPLDIYNLTIGLHTSFEQLLANTIELNVVDGVILPNMKMSAENEQCSFLNQEGRCEIHSFRPGVCRLFPLGRYYENGSFKYFLQVHECKYPNKSKIKLKKWIGITDIQKNQDFIIKWHDFIEDIQTQLSKIVNDELLKKIDMFILQHFYMEPYNGEEDFYSQFDARLGKAKVVTSTLLKALENQHDK